jgi:HNH endonuclease
MPVRQRERPRRRQRARATARTTPPSSRCSVKGCARQRRSTGSDLCSAHAQRLYRHGDVQASKPLRQPIGRHITAKGYVLVTPAKDDAIGRAMLGKGHQVLEHRLVMAHALGRALRPRAETVHHRDGNRANNELANLELWLGQHGNGARQQDVYWSGVLWHARSLNLEAVAMREWQRRRAA